MSHSSKQTGTHKVSPDAVGLVIGRGGRTVTGICRLVGAGCRIQHTGGGHFEIEAWTKSAVELAKVQIDRQLERKPRRAKEVTVLPEEKGWTAVPQRPSFVKEEEQPVRPEVEEMGRFAALEVEETADVREGGSATKSPAETKHEAKLVRNAAKKQRKVVVPVSSLGFVDEDAGAFQRHRAWVNRTRYHGGEVPKDQEEHPSLRRHLGRQGSTAPSVAVQTPTADDFPPLGGGQATMTESGVWGDADSLSRVRSDESFEIEGDGGALRLEDLTTPDKTTATSPPSLGPKMGRQPSSVSIPKMQPLSRSAWGDDADSDGEEAFAQHLEAVAGEYDETEWA